MIPSLPFQEKKNPLINWFQRLSVVLKISIIAIAILIGWYVIHAQNQNNKNLNDVHASNSITKAGNSFDACQKMVGSSVLQTYPEVCVTNEGVQFTKPTSTNGSSPAAAYNYIVIKEWGVRAKYTSSLTLQYRVVQGTQQFKDDALFTSSELVKAGGGQACGIDSLDDGSGGSLYSSGGGFIQRSLPNEKIEVLSDDNRSTTMTTKQYVATLDKQAYNLVGGYYYYIPKNSDEEACGTGTVRDLQDQTKAAVRSLVPTTETIQAQ